jgi:hypothetical protein
MMVQQVTWLPTPLHLQPLFVLHSPAQHTASDSHRRLDTLCTAHRLTACMMGCSLCTPLHTLRS